MYTGVYLYNLGIRDKMLYEHFFTYILQLLVIYIDYDSIV